MSFLKTEFEYEGIWNLIRVREKALYESELFNKPNSDPTFQKPFWVPSFQEPFWERGFQEPYPDPNILPKFATLTNSIGVIFSDRRLLVLLPPFLLTLASFLLCQHNMSLCVLLTLSFYILFF